MSDTPKYVGLIKSSDDGEFLVTDTHTTETPTRAELEEHLTECLANEVYGQDSIAELYIRERDTRRQFSPTQITAIGDNLLKFFGLHLSNRQTTLIVESILDEYRKLIHEP